jgi:heme/copper-type cytochrome/quinol oxidase subunit 2
MMHAIKQCDSTSLHRGVNVKKIVLFIGTLFVCLSSPGFAYIPAEIRPHCIEGTERHMRTDMGLCPLTGRPAIRRFVFMRQPAVYLRQSGDPEPETREAVIHEIRLEVTSGGITPSQCIAARGETVRFFIFSEDADRTFSIREYGIDLHVAREDMEGVEFVADKAGEFSIICRSAGKGAAHQSRALLVVTE